VRLHFPPLGLIFLYCFFAGLYLFRYVAMGRFVIYNASFLFLALAVFEIGLSYGHLRRDSSDLYVGFDTTYGFRNIPGVFYAKLTYGFGTRTIYDVKYSIDDNGVRKALLHQSGKPVFFFGCSFTFGVGVNDDETLPHQFSTISNLRTVNF